MNESVIENLFSATTPRPDISVPLSGRRADDPNEFGDHLRQAGSPTPEPWWRAAPDRPESDQRPPEVDQAPPPRPPVPAPAPVTRDSFNDSDTNDASTSKTDRETTDRDSDLPAGAVATIGSDLHPVQTAPDKPCADQHPANDPPRAKPSPAATGLTKNVSTSATVDKAAIALQDSPSSKHEPVASQANSKVTADTTQEETPVDGIAAKLAAKPNEQPTPSALIAATAAKETAATTVNNPDSEVDSPASKTTSERAAAGKKQSARPADQIGQSSTKRTAAAHATSNSSVAADEHPGNADAANSGDKRDAKRDSTAVDDKPTAEHLHLNTPLRTDNIRQVLAANAAVSTAANADKAAVKDAAADSAQKIAKTAAGQKGSTLAAFGRIDRDATLTARGPRQSGDSPDMPRIDPARFVSRVARAIETAQDRGGTLNLRLSPPELGAMRLELAVKQGVMTAKVETDTAAARQALLDHLPALRERLAEHSIRLERFDVDVRRDGTGDQSNAGPNGRQYQEHQQHYQAPATRTTTTPIRGEEAAAEPLPVNRIITDTSINLVA